MARIPIYQKQFVTLTQATLQPAAGLGGQVQTDIYGVPIAPKITTQPLYICLLYTSPSPRDRTRSRMPSSA